jgi:Tfp pilus assembly protein PilO
MESQRMTGLRKRQQIAQAGRTMFIWIAAAAVAVSLAAVALQFLFTQWTYNNKVVGAKYKASSTLAQNIKNSKELKNKVNELVGNQALASIRQEGSNNNLQVVLDALPSSPDMTALATSVQQAIVPRSGVSLESLAPDIQSSDSEEGEAPVDSKDPVEQRFTIIVTGNYESIRRFVGDLERSIRPMKVETIGVGGSEQSLRATLQVVTYYQSAKTADVTKKAVR